jgi:hypothetical protein
VIVNDILRRPHNGCGSRRTRPWGDAMACGAQYDERPSCAGVSCGQLGAPAAGASEYRPSVAAIGSAWYVWRAVDGNTFTMVIRTATWQLAASTTRRSCLPAASTPSRSKLGGAQELCSVLRSSRPGACVHRSSQPNARHRAVRDRREHAAPHSPAARNMRGRGGGGEAVEVPSVVIPDLRRR